MAKADLEVARSIMRVAPRAMRVIRQDLRAAAKSDLTVPQFRFLVRLNSSPATNSEVAQWMGLTAPSASRLADTLIKRNYVRRSKARHDARECILELTPTGRKRYNEIRRSVQPIYVSKVSLLPLSRKKALLGGLAVLDELIGAWR